MVEGNGKKKAPMMSSKMSPGHPPVLGMAGFPFDN
jgi:hypothetical protein